jgi:hypothetical protein
MKKTGLIFLWCVIIYLAVGLIGCRERVVSPPGDAPTPTMTATAAPFGYTYDFEGGVNGWILGGGAAFTNAVDVPKASVPGGAVPSGDYCVAITSSFSASAVAGEWVLHPAAPDFTEGTSITARVYVPADLPASYSVQVFVLTMPGYGFVGNNVTALTLGAWNTIPLMLSGITNINNVDTVAVEVLRNGGADWAGTIYVDFVNIY